MKIFINGEIGWVYGNAWDKEQLFNMPNEPLSVFIDSVGGSVTDGNSIAAMLRAHGQNAEVKTVGIGLVASIATVILLAGTRVEMDKDALLMIHNPSADYVSGDAKELRQLASTLDTIKNVLAERYVDKIAQNGKLVDGDRQKTKNLVLQYMAAETWFSAQEALDFGLIDAIATYKEEAQMLAEAAPPAPIMDTMQRMVACYKNAPSSIQTKFKNNQSMNTEKVEMTKEQKGLWQKFLSFFVNEKEEVTTPEPIATPEPVAVEPEAAPQAEISEEDMIKTLTEKGYSIAKASEVTALAEQVKSLEAKLVQQQAAPKVVEKTQAPKTEFDRLKNIFANHLNTK